MLPHTVINTTKRLMYQLSLNKTDMKSSALHKLSSISPNFFNFPSFWATLAPFLIIMYKYVLASKCDPVSPMHCTLLHTLLFMEYMCTLRNRTRSLTLLLSGDLVQLYQTTSLKNWKFGVNFGPNFRLNKMIIWWKNFTVAFSRLHTRKTGNVLQKNIKWEIYLNCWFDQTTLLKNWQRGVYFDPNFKLNKMVRNLPELLVPPDNILVAAATLFLQLSQVAQVLAALATCNVLAFIN